MALQDVLTQSIAETLQHTETPVEEAAQVGANAMRYFELSQNRSKDYQFNFQAILNTKGS